MIIIDADRHALDQESMYRFARFGAVHGVHRILFPSDYPHWDVTFPEALNELMERQDVSDQLKRKIFCENPQRLYGFTVDPRGLQGLRVSVQPVKTRIMPPLEMPSRGQE